MLCWSERYVGKWRLGKTSNINGAISLGFHDPGEFSRQNFSLSVSQEFLDENRERDRLRVYICRAEDFEWMVEGSFLLYNTHSAPIADSASAVPKRNIDRLMP